MDELYKKFYKMVTGVDAPIDFGDEVWYSTPQRYGRELETYDGRKYYAVPGYLDGVTGWVNRMVYPNIRAAANAIERNNRDAELLKKYKGDVRAFEAASAAADRANNSFFKSAYAAEREMD